MNRRFGLLIALGVLIGSLGWGMVRLIELRNQRGDIYPRYSTLRTDPLGSKVLYDALQSMPGSRVERNYRPLERLKPEGAVTLVYLATPYQARWGESELPHFESMVREGARAVFTFQREFKTTNSTRLPTRGSKRAAATPRPGSTPAPSAETEDEDPPGIAFADATARWGLSFDIAQDEDSEALNAFAERTDAAGDLEEKLPWHSALYFKGLSEVWRILYRCNGVPVVVERDFGGGTLVLISDSYLFSNEGLRNARAPRFLDRMLGESRAVIFDEEHHGISEQTNIVGLMHKYHLEAAGLAMLAVLALFVWKSSVPFLPPQSERPTDAAEVSGADAAEALVNLLQRSVPVDGLLGVCAQEWQESRGRRGRPEETSHLQSILRDSGGADPVPLYRAIAIGLKRR